jgi:hypothetical protein
MPFDLTPNLQNVQEIEVDVTGPDGANRLFLCSGWVGGAWGGGQNQANAVTFLVGPKLGRKEMIRASCAVGILGYSSPGGMGQQSAGITASDADWDDESGRVMVRIDYMATLAMLLGFSYQVMILAEREAEPAPPG